MKGSIRKPLHSRAQSQGSIYQNINDNNQVRDLYSSNKYLRVKGRDESFLPSNTPQRLTPSQSFSSGFWNNSTSSFGNNLQQNFQRTGLSFKANNINEIKEIGQQKLTILRKTNANEFYNSKKSKEINSNSIFNNTIISSPEKKHNQMDYYSKNIITNQLFFKKTEYGNDRNQQEQIKEKVAQQANQQQQIPQIQENESQQQEIKQFVKELYQKERQLSQQKIRSNLQIQNIDDQFEGNTISTPASTQYGFFANTPKQKDIFVTKLNSLDFKSSNYSTMVKESAQKQLKFMRNRISQPDISESTRLQKSSAQNSKLLDNSEYFSQKHQKVREQLDYTSKTNQENELAEIQINPMYETNNFAQNKLLQAFKKSGEIDKNPNQKVTPNLAFKGQTPNTLQGFRQEKEQELLSSNIINQSQNEFDQIENQQQKKKSLSFYQDLKELKLQKNKRTFYVLFIFIDNLSNVKRKNNLKYKIIKIPHIYNLIPQKKVENDFEELKVSLQHLIGLNLKYLFFFRQNGYPLPNHLSFQNIDYNNEAIFFGSQGIFSGIQNIACSEQNKQNLYNAIQNLCMKVKMLNQNLQDHSIPSQVSQIEDQIEKYKILTKEEISQMKNKFLVNRIAQSLTYNPLAQIKRFNQDLPTKPEAKLEKIEKQYQEDINKTKKNIAELPDNFERIPDKFKIENIREIARYIDGFILEVDSKCQQKKKSNKDKDYTSGYQGLEDLWNSQKQKTKTNYIQENIEKYNNKNSIMKTLQQRNQELFLQNIPKLLNKYELSRHDLHSIYILYKALLNVSVQRMNYQEVLEKGIDFKTFELGVDRLSSQGEEIIQRMCNYNSFINWESFLEILSSIQGKDLESKINIFIKVCDTDKSGNLSKDEIEQLCRICLEKFIPQGDDNIINQLIEYFTKLLFSSLDVDLEDEIPLFKLKEAIIGGHPESDLLCFFCGVN